VKARSRDGNRVQEGQAFLLGSRVFGCCGDPLTGTLLQRAMDLMRSEITGIAERIDRHAEVCLNLFDVPVDYSVLRLDQLCTFLHFIERREYSGKECWSELECP